MPISLACPQCKANVDARNSDAGKSIRCGVCWAEVVVPADNTEPAAAPAPLPTAKLLPPPVTAAKAMPPMAKLLPAAPAVAKAVPPPPAKTAHSKEDDDRPFPKRSSRRARDDDDDEEGDNKKKAGRSAPVGMLIGISLVGLLVVGGITTAIVYMVKDSGDTAKDSSKNSSKDGYVAPAPLWDAKNDNNKPGNFNNGFNNNNGFQNPVQPPIGFGQPPAFPQPPAFVQPPGNIVPFKEPEWVAVTSTDGYEAKTPANMTAAVTSSRTIRQDRTIQRVQGKKQGPLTVVVPRAVFAGFEIEFMDLPAAVTMPIDQIAKDIYFLRPNSTTNPSTLGGHDGFEVVDNNPGLKQIVRVVKIGPRLYMAKIQLNAPDQHPKSEDYASKFFDSFKISFDANTPAPPGNEFGKPANPFPRPDPMNPVPGMPAELPANPVVAPVGVVAPGVFARVQPFWALVVVPERNEILTLGPRLPGTFGRGGGILRRYTLGDFKLKGSYSMPRAVTNAVYDSKTGTLITTTANSTRVDATIRDSERVVAFGDVEYYDLNSVFKGTVKETDELKPTNTVSISTAKLTGLEFSPDRQFLYTVKTTQVTQAGRRFWKAKLLRIDYVTRKVKDELELLSPVHAVKVAPDGKTIFLAEIQFSDFGGEILGAGGGKIVCVDTTAWRMDRAIVLPGAPFDFDITADGNRLVAVCAGRTSPILVSVPTNGGDTIELNPSENTKAGGYCVISPNGQRLVTSTRQGEGVDLYSVKNLAQKEALTVVAKGREAGNDAAKTALGGHFSITPDGRFAVFQIGVVIDLNNHLGKANQ